jgi:hypothetical protein
MVVRVFFFIHQLIEMKKILSLLLQTYNSWEDKEIDRIGELSYFYIKKNEKIKNDKSIYIYIYKTIKIIFLNS